MQTPLESQEKITGKLTKNGLDMQGLEVMVKIF
jgi:hypothetical protein